MVKKRLKWFNFGRGFALLLALALLFIGLLMGEGPPPLYGPALQKRGSEALSDSFRFAVLSDSHKGWGVFKPIMKELERDGCSFAVHCGDFVNESKEDRYRFFFRELAEVKGETPIYFAPGNHDVFDDKGRIYGNRYSLENFRKYCGPDHYWFSWGNAAFVVLNDGPLTISEDQFHWLETTLREFRRTFTHIFVFMHVPPFDPREGHSYCLPEMIGKRLMRLMEEFGVDYVFCGHIHCYFREVINGVTYIITPPAGGTPRCSHPFYGYVQITVHGRELKDSVIKVEKDWWIQLKGDIQYELRVRSPFLLPFLTVVLGQSSLYFLAL
jgi:3',5'-cyclic AMP phosphodiesterase CpdA